MEATIATLTRQRWATCQSAVLKSAAMQAKDFVRKWGPGGPAADLTERAGAQAHFIDLCRLLGVAEPGDPERYCFERGVTKAGSAAGRTDGCADVWPRTPS